MDNVCAICGLVPVEDTGEVCVGCHRDMSAILMTENARRFDGAGMTAEILTEDDERGMVEAEGVAA